MGCGIKDRNGREICVGDLVQYHNVSPNTKPEYWNPIYVLKWVPPCYELQYVGGGKNVDVAFTLRHYSEELEIIGLYDSHAL
jgi:hypothetical protein